MKFFASFLSLYFLFFSSLLSAFFPSLLSASSLSDSIRFHVTWSLQKSPDGPLLPLGTNMLVDQGIDQLLQGLTGLTGSGAGGKKKFVPFSGSTSHFVVSSSTISEVRTNFCLAGPLLGDSTMLPGWPKLLNLITDTACPPGIGGSDCAFPDGVEYKAQFGAGVATGVWKGISLTNGDLYDPLPCCGDCNGDGVASATEWNTCIAIRDGGAAYGTCPACDCDQSGVVDSADINHIAFYTLSTTLGCYNGSSGACLNYLAINPGTKGVNDVWTVIMRFVVVP